MTRFLKVKILSILLIFIAIANINAQQNLAQEVYAIFEQACLICHGENGSYRESLLIEHTELIQGGTVVPNEPETSELYKRLLGDTEKGPQMPLGQPPLNPEAIETIRQWIAEGAPDWDAIFRPKPDFITNRTMLETIEKHVHTLSPSDRSFARYFTLTHLYNAGETTEALNAYRRALSKMINSLSWGRKIVRPQPIDAADTIFYVDLRDYEWDIRNDAWTQIEQAYPYKMTFDAPTQAHLHEKLTILQQEMDCEVPFVHVDWFLATASLPPLYYDILQLPLTERILETMLEVSVKENIQNAPGERVWRAGFNESRVSNHNRVVERHTFEHGAYWKSYDFAGSVGTQNIFTHPLSFKHDGSEIIFNLPNGLQAYYLVNGDGMRLDVAPTDIVSNPAASDPAVRNGLSCIGCHTKGMQTFEDEVRAVVEQADNPPFSKEQVLALYVKKMDMDTLITQDTLRYREALEATGGVFGGIEPIQRFHEVFQGPLDAAHAAAALGLQTESLLEKIQTNVDLQNLGLLVLENGAIKRDTWTEQWIDIVHALNSQPETIVTPVEPTPEHTSGTFVNIPDPELRKSILFRLRGERIIDSIPDPDYQITMEEMARLKRISIYWYIEDLEGLQFATGLTSLYIDHHLLSDISLLTEFANLERLTIEVSNISDLSTLEGLTKLEYLEITGDNNISDLSPLAGLTKLERLSITGNNNISDISPLAGLTKLAHLDISGQVTLRFSSTSKSERYRSFGRSGNGISDISPLTGLTKLETLSLWDSNISDLSPLAGLTALKFLNLNNNNISDLSPLAGLTNLVSLSLGDYSIYTGETYSSYNNISDISPLTGLIALKSLDLSGNNISDLSPLEVLPKFERLELEILNLSSCNISDITVIIGMTWLKELNLNNNNISDISPLAELTELKKLILFNNNISDISPLKDFFVPHGDPGDRIKSNILYWSSNPGYNAPTKSIPGPWLQVVVLGNHDAWGQGWKPLANASDGAVTEVDIAATGATEGASVGANVWELQQVFGSDLGDQLENLGEETLSTQTIVYGCKFLDSPRNQETTLYIPSAYFIKVWLNGDLLYSEWNQSQVVPVTLKKGKNILLFGVSGERLLNRYFSFPDSTEFTSYIPGVAWSLSHSPIQVGDTFTLDLSARNVLNLAEWQFDISFDPTALEVLEVNERDFMKQNGGTFFQKGSIDNTAGKIKGFSSSILGSNGANGTGVILSLTLKAKTDGDTQVALQNFQLLTTSSEPIPAGPHKFIFTIKEFLIGDVNRDGKVSIQDMVLVSRVFGKDASDYPLADINQDSIINILDLLTVAQHLGEVTEGAAPNSLAVDSEELTPELVQAWIKKARIQDDGSLVFRQGIANLQKLLAALIPEKTELLANFPNPFNPETWIPYQLAKPAEVTLRIYTANGKVVRKLAIGQQPAGNYQEKNRAAYWDGKNAQGEPVSSGVYFYTITADDFSATRKMLI
ncbi:T9SS type A sorting domain-containing protein, partial [Candidatus Poribacteria bacterium]|nr:T9SS type A sorting domain-containing protein [Candidatus Poribacteria bacterium]